MTPRSEQTRQLLRHPKALCNMVRRIVIEAGDMTLPFFEQTGPEDVTIKADGSPCVAVEIKVESLMIDRLAAIVPDIPVIAEEAVYAGTIPEPGDCFWLIDPVDGTKEFIRGPNGSGDYTVNIALVSNGEPVLGVVYAPVHGELYAGCGAGTAIRWLAESGHEKQILVRDPPASGLTVLASRNHSDPARLERFLSDYKVAKILHRGSSLKLCLIAAGKADLYPRQGPTSEWDVAAGDAVLRSAGGKIVDMNGASLRYGQAARQFINPDFVASSGFWPLPQEEI